MPQRHYFCKLIPPRPTFPGDMTDAERRLMDEHRHYFEDRFAAGSVVIYGSVMAAGGAFGLAVLEVASEADARHFFENDPSVKAGMNTFEVYPMMVAAARAL